MTLSKRLKDALEAFKGGPKTKIGQMYFGMDLKRCWECEYKNRTPIRDNLLVTAGARVAYMHDKGIVDIPGGLKGEDEIASFITHLVDEYLELGNGNFDIWLEEAIMKGYGVKDVNLCSTTSSS